jgi:dienelactone hydrolase
MTRRQFGVAAAFGFAGAASAQHDIGNHYPLIESLAVRNPSLSWLEPRFKKLKKWKQQAQGKYLELLHYRPAAVDPRAEVVRTEDRGSFTLEHITFQTTPAIRVPAFLLKPKKEGRLPAIVALHDHGGFYMWGKEKLVQLENEHPVLTEFKKRSYAGHSIAEDMARAGYLVIVIDMFYWGERRMLVPGDAEDWRERPATLTRERINAFNQRSGQNEPWMGRTIAATGGTWPGIMLWDDIRTVDYLVSRPDVDPNRIGCLGLSVGGLRSAYLAAADPRIKAAVVIGWMTSFPSQLREKIMYTIGPTKLIPGLYRYLDYPDIASLAMPAAMLVINGGKDQLFDSKGVQIAFQKLKDCYAKARIPDKVQCTLYPDAPHEFNEAMQEEAWRFLSRFVSASGPS